MDHTKLDAILALIPSKLDKAVAKAEALVVRADSVFRNDDFSWVEGAHPRDADGKFIAGSAGHGALSYQSTLKPGQKGSGLGLATHMIKAGTYSYKDIKQAALTSYDLKKLTPGHVKEIAAKYGVAVPEHSVQPPKSEEKQPEKAAEPQQGPDQTKNNLKAALTYGVPPDVTKELGSVFEHWDKLTAENKPKVEEKLKEIVSAINMTDTKESLSKVLPIIGSGMSVNTVNNALAKIKSAHGASVEVPSTPAYTPSTPAQVKVYDAFKDVPHYEQDHINYFQDSSGKKVKAKLKTNTENIPGDFYAKVSSAYGNNPDNGNTDAVGSAMQAYGNSQSKSWSGEQTTALSSYKGSGYSSINKYLLGNEEHKGEWVEKQVEHIRDAMKVSIIPADTPVYRGLNTSLENLTGFSDPKKAVGRCFVHANFASVSRSRSTSEFFGTKTVLKFTIPAGSNGIVLGQQAGGEQEIVLPDHAVFRVMKVESDTVHVQYLGTQSDE